MFFQNAKRKKIAPHGAAGEDFSRSLAALLVGAAVMILAMWWAVFQIAGTLAHSHLQQKMADIGEKAQTLLRTDPDLSPATRTALFHLAIFRDISRMELRDANDNLLWRNQTSTSHARQPLPSSDAVILEKRNIDGMLRDWARYQTMLKLKDGRSVRLVMETDVGDMLAYYERVALLIAKAMTTVIVAAVLLMGWLMMRRLHDSGQTQAVRDDALSEEIARLNRQNARMLRRMAAFGEYSVEKRRNRRASANADLRDLRA